MNPSTIRTNTRFTTNPIPPARRSSLILGRFIPSPSSGYVARCSPLGLRCGFLHSHSRRIRQHRFGPKFWSALCSQPTLSPPHRPTQTRRASALARFGCSQKAEPFLNPYRRIWPRRLGHSRPGPHHDGPAHLHGLLRKRSFLAGLRCPVEMCRAGGSQLRRHAQCSFTPSAPISPLRLRCSFLRVCAYAPSRASVVSLAHSMTSQITRPPRPVTIRRLSLDCSTR